MWRIIKIAVISTLIPLLVACKSKFDRNKWLQEEDGFFPYRNSMIDDLIKSYKLKGKSLKEIVSLLGQPQSPADSIFNIFYNVDVKYSGIDPSYTKSLSLQLNKDTIVENFEVEEYNH